MNIHDPHRLNPYDCIDHLVLFYCHHQARMIPYTWEVPKSDGQNSMDVAVHVHALQKMNHFHFNGRIHISCLSWSVNYFNFPCIYLYLWWIWAMSDTARFWKKSPWSGFFAASVQMRVNSTHRLWPSVCSLTVCRDTRNHFSMIL